LGQSSRRKYSNFSSYPNFLTTQCRRGGRKPPNQNQLDPFSRFDTTPACDRQTQTQIHDDSQQLVSITSRGKNQWSCSVHITSPLGCLCYEHQLLVYQTATSHVMCNFDTCITGNVPSALRSCGLMRQNYVAEKTTQNIGVNTALVIYSLSRGLCNSSAILATLKIFDCHWHWH